MDLQTRKLNLIEYFVRLADEKIITIFEEIIIELKSDNSRKLKPFTQKELLDRARKSNQDYLEGNYRSQEIVELESQSWWLYESNLVKFCNWKIKGNLYFINHPKSGQLEDSLKKLDEGYRYLVVGNYKLIYKEVKEGVLITDVFDTRQNPVKMNKPNKNK